MTKISSLIAIVGIIYTCKAADESAAPYSSEQEVNIAWTQYKRSWRPPSQADGRKFLAARESQCEGRPSKIIAMSLYGSEGSNFFDGAMENAHACAQLYPGWILRVYSSIGAAAAAALRSQGIEVIEMPRPEGIYGMFWRFFAASDPCVDYAIFRDTDSLLNPRERAAVDEWIEKGAKAHSMIDNPEHANWAVQGGMWGIRGGVIIDMEARAAAWGLWTKKLDDMHFLQRVIWPEVQKDAVVHSSVASVWGGIPFPNHAPWDGHVGQQVFKAPYVASCPVRSREPEEDLLLNASSHLRHNGLVYRYRAQHEEPTSPAHTHNLALAATHLAAALSCARWAVEINPAAIRGWGALKELLEIDRPGAPCPAQLTSTRASPSTSTSTTASTSASTSASSKPNWQAAACAIRIDSLLHRLTHASSGPPSRSVTRDSVRVMSTRPHLDIAELPRHTMGLPTDGFPKSEGGRGVLGEVLEYVEGMQSQGAERGSWVLCRVEGGDGRQLEAAVTCLLVALAARRALILIPPPHAPYNYSLFLDGHWLRLFSPTAAARLAPLPDCLLATGGDEKCQEDDDDDDDDDDNAGNKDDSAWHMRLGGNMSDHDGKRGREELLCGDVISAWAGRRVIRVRAEGWVPAVIYNSAVGPAVVSALRAAAGAVWGGVPSDEAAAAFVVLVGAMTGEGGVGRRGGEAVWGHLFGEGGVSHRLVIGLHVRGGRLDGSESSRDVHALLPHPSALPTYVTCAYAAAAGAPTADWLVVADTAGAGAGAVRDIAIQEGGLVRRETVGVGGEGGGIEAWETRSGCRIIVIVAPLAVTNETLDDYSRRKAWASAVGAWALAGAEVLVSSHTSSYTSLPRALAALCPLVSPPPVWCAGRGGWREEMVMSRDGLCVRRPDTGGGPMSGGAGAFKSAPCWSEAVHSRIGWAAIPLTRPPRPRPASAAAV